MLAFAARPTRAAPGAPPPAAPGALHSAKGGAVETGCSELYDIIY